jgi:HK97 family phage portal protein
VYVYRAIKLIADSIADLDYVLYRKVKGELRKVENSPYLDLLNSPNETQGKSEFLREYFSTLLLSGEGFCEGVFGRRQPQFLYVRRPDRITLELGNYKQVIENYIFKVNGRQKKIPENEMSFIKYFNPIDDWRGMSPITAASLSIDINNEYKKWNFGYLANGARPSLAIKLAADTEITPDQKARLKEQFTQENTGAYNVGKPLLLTGGADVTQIGSRPSEMDGIEGQKLTAREIGLIFGIDPILMGDTSSSTYNNKQQAKKDFFTDTAFPLFQMWIDELNRWLTPYYGENLVLSFDRNISELADDIKELLEVYSKAWELGAITRNEYRMKLQLSQTPDGNVYKTKLQDIYTPMQQVTEKQQIQYIEQKSINSFDKVLKSLDKLIEKKELTDKNGLKVAESIDADEIYDDVISAYTLEVAQVGANTLLEIESDFKFDAFSKNTQKYLKEEVGKKITTMSETLKEKVRREIEKGMADNLTGFQIKENIAKMVDEQYLITTNSHLQTIVRTETMDALTFGTNEAYIQSGIVDGKEWVTTIDGRERNSHAELDGQTVGVNEKFVVPSNGHSTDRPHGFGIAEEDIQCRCINSAVINQKSMFPDIEKKRQFWEQKDREAESYEDMFFKVYKKAFNRQKNNVEKEIDKYI